MGVKISMSTLRITPKKLMITNSRGQTEILAGEINLDEPIQPVQPTEPEQPTQEDELYLPPSDWQNYFARPPGRT